MATIAEKLINQGMDKARWDMVMNMLREGFSIDIIGKISGFTAGQINEFKEKMQGQLLNAA